MPSTTKKQSKKVYQEERKGWIDRLSIYLLKQMDMRKDDEHPPVTNIRRFFGYIIDFILANLLVAIPVTLIVSIVTKDTFITQDLRIVPLPYAWLITGCVLILFLLYYIYIPYKVWPGQTPAKRFLGYRMVMMDNSEVTLKALFLRNFVGLVLIEGAVFMTSYLLQLFSLSTGIVIPDFISKLYYFILFLSAMITLTNPNRRMLHDLLGKTKVYEVSEGKDTYNVL